MSADPLSVPPRTRSALHRTAQILADDAEALVEAQLGALRRFASYDGIPDDELRASARRNVMRVVRTLQGSADLPMEMSEDERSSSRQRARQGIATEDVVAAYREVIGVLRDAFIAAGPRAGAPVEAILAGTRVLWQLTDRLSNEVVAAHHQMDVDIARRDERQRLAFLQRLLTGGLLTADAPVTATAYGLLAGQQYWVFRGRHLTGGLQSLARQVESSCAGRRFAPLLGPIDGDLAGVAARRPAVTDDGAGVLAVVGPVDLPVLPQAFAEATRLLSIAVRYGRTGLVDGASLSVRIAVVQENDLGEALSARYVQPVLEQATAPVALLESIRSYLGHRRRVVEAAKALSVHANTLRYRIERFTALTGADLQDTETIIEVWWALEYWTVQRGHPTEPEG